MSTPWTRRTATAFVAAICLGVLVASPEASGLAGCDPNDWPMYNRDPAGSRTNPAETKLSPATVGRLQVAWRFSTPGSVYGTPAVVEGTVYAGDVTGTFYALDANSGLPKWAHKVAAPITGSALVAGDVVIFGDLGGNIYGLNRQTGLEAWPPLHPDPSPEAAIWGSAAPAGGSTVVMGVASNGETFSIAPVYPCCTSRGSVVAFDAVTGILKWQRYTITADEGAQGSSGASVWVTPTYDPDTNRVYVATGNNFTEPATDTSDAVLALDAATGAVIWKNQLHANDIWNLQYPSSDEHPDYDFGDSPQVIRLRSGKRAVGVGQKSGFYHLLDADTGKLLDNIQVEPGGILGGLFADTAYTNGVTYANGINWPDATGTPSLVDPSTPRSGDLVAVRSDVAGSMKTLWRFHTDTSPNAGGVAVANGVVYFHSSVTGYLYALSQATGKELRKVDVGPGVTGPSISNGRVFLGAGDTFGVFVPDARTGSIVALALPGDVLP